MTNLRGAMVYINSATVESYISQTISSLGIVAPWTISVRYRFQWANLGAGANIGICLIVGFGGDADDEFQKMIIDFDNDNLNAMDLLMNQANSDLQVSASTYTGLSYDNRIFKWLQLSLSETGVLTGKDTRDTSITIPSAWDNTYTNSTVVFTAEQIIQTLKIGLKTSVLGSDDIVILDIDEIHVIQD